MPGLVKLRATSGNNFGLTADSSAGAYINIPTASATAPGIVKTGTPVDSPAATFGVSTNSAN